MDADDDDVQEQGDNDNGEEDVIFESEVLTEEYSRREQVSGCKQRVATQETPSSTRYHSSAHLSLLYALLLCLVNFPGTRWHSLAGTAAVGDGCTHTGGVRAVHHQRQV